MGKPQKLCQALGYVPRLSRELCSESETRKARQRIGPRLRQMSIQSREYIYMMQDLLVRIEPEPLDFGADLFPLETEKKCFLLSCSVKQHLVERLGGGWPASVTHAAC